jgi:peptidoglycan/xylan/chitin deacetylase (PgdA/CDA1 family)
MRPPSRQRLRYLPHRLYALKAAAVRVRSLAWLARNRGRSSFSGLRVLVYHRVHTDDDPLAVTPSRFQEQMALLAAEGYRVLDLAQAVELLGRGELPDKAVALNFDDGYHDIVQHALPVLERHGLRATVFVVPGAIDGTTTFEWYEQQPRLLSWQEICALDGSSPLRFEPHTLTHPNLVTLPAEVAAREIEGSKQEVERRLGRPAEIFSYPAGLFGERERELVARAGYRLAVSCEPGLNLADMDPLAVRRVQIDARDSLLDFRAKVGGGHDRPLPLRATYRRLRYGVVAPLGGAPAAMSPRTASSRQ